MQMMLRIVTHCHECQSLKWHALEFCSLPVGYILKLFCVALPVKLCFYACTFFACIGYCEVMHGAVLSISGLS